MHVIVPVKRFADAKRRLSPCLAPWQRHALARAMLCDVFQTLERTRAVAGIIVVSHEPELDELARQHRFVRLAPPVEGLNHAVTCALIHLATHGVRRALVLHADLPLATPDDIAQMVEANQTVVLAPDRHRRGTNGMVLPCDGSLRPSFGGDSFARHRRAADAAGLASTVATLRSLALDIDEPDDLARLLNTPWSAQRRSVALLTSWQKAEFARAFTAPRADSTFAGIAWG